MGMGPMSSDGVIGPVADVLPCPARPSSARPVAPIEKQVKKNGPCCGAPYKQFASRFPAGNQHAGVSRYSERPWRDAAPQQDVRTPQVSPMIESAVALPGRRECFAHARMCDAM
jgi:hypothetical protein